MVMLKTTGAYHFMRSSVQGLANCSLTLDSLGLNPYFTELQDRLWSVSTPDQAVALIQQHLYRYFDQKTKIGPGDFTPVLNFMLRHPAGLTVQALGKKFRCSDRWIEKQCVIQTGLSPKSWIRLIRFRAAANFWLKHPNTSWMALVARFGYTDQSHLIRDFREFTGNPPTFHFAQYGEMELDFKQHQAGLSSLLED
ncbi:MAG: AraC family transcriptional regulator [Saprospiraceae bacterium]|nr:AraC family transcriptional regulator [Saprospiraceae bacterium]